METPGFRPGTSLHTCEKYTRGRVLLANAGMHMCLLLCSGRSFSVLIIASSFSCSPVDKR